MVEMGKKNRSSLYRGFDIPCPPPCFWPRASAIKAIEKKIYGKGNPSSQSRRMPMVCGLNGPRLHESRFLRGLGECREDGRWLGNLRRLPLEHRNSELGLTAPSRILEAL